MKTQEGLAERSWIETADVINTRSLKSFLKLLRKIH